MSHCLTVHIFDSICNYCTIPAIIFAISVWFSKTLYLIKWCHFYIWRLVMLRHKVTWKELNLKLVLLWSSILCPLCGGSLNCVHQYCHSYLTQYQLQQQIPRATTIPILTVLQFLLFKLSLLLLTRLLLKSLDKLV